MPTAGRSPEEWLGRHVVVEVVSGPGIPDSQHVARLDGINDWGVLLGNGEDHPLSEPDREAIVFYPWRHIFAIWPASEKDL